MKLTAGMLLDRLSSSMDVAFYGRSLCEPSLSYIEMPDPEQVEFQSDHLYLCRSRELPLAPKLEPRATIISVGPNTPGSYIVGECVCLEIKHESFQRVFNVLRGIMDEFQEWDRQLEKLISDSDALRKMLEASCGVFENPLAVSDTRFEILASTPFGSGRHQRNHNGMKNDEWFDAAIFPDSQTVDIERADSYSFQLAGFPGKAVTLHDGDGVRIGTLGVVFCTREERTSDMALLTHLASRIAPVVENRPGIPDNETLRLFLHEVICGEGLAPHHSEYFKSFRSEQNHIALYLQAEEAFPLEYACRIIEQRFSESVAFPENDGVSAAAFIRESDGMRVYRTLAEMGIKAGISHPFSDLAEAKPFFIQARFAYQVGHIVDQAQTVFLFEDYALLYMLKHSLGALTFDMLCPGNAVSFFKNANPQHVHTLKTLLDNNMEKSKTAVDLGIHRSTLIARLKRIESDLQVDLGIPENRLQLMMLLKYAEIRDVVENEV